MAVDAGSVSIEVSDDGANSTARRRHTATGRPGCASAQALKCDLRRAAECAGRRRDDGVLVATDRMRR